MAPIQLFFKDYELLWPVQHVPEHWKSRTATRSKAGKPPAAHIYPVVPFVPMLRMFEQKGHFRYPKGHTRVNVDNPGRSDANQACWLLLRQLPSLGLTDAVFTRYLKALLSYGFVEKRLGRHGQRYRISWYGQQWLKKRQ